MREILFRGKDVDNPHEWVYGFLSVSGEENPGFVIDYPIKDFNVYGQVDIIPDTAGQFTGLTDKNGRKIFKGDIGKYKQTDGAKRNGQPISCTGKVIYNTKTASYAVESKDEAGCKYFDYFPIKDFEVIGNIHDNPELVEVHE